MRVARHRPSVLAALDAPVPPHAVLLRSSPSTAPSRSLGSCTSAFESGPTAEVALRDDAHHAVEEAIARAAELAAPAAGRAPRALRRTAERARVARDRGALARRRRVRVRGLALHRPARPSRDARHGRARRPSGRAGRRRRREDPRRAREPGRPRASDRSVAERGFRARDREEVAAARHRDRRGDHRRARRGSALSGARERARSGGGRRERATRLHARLGRVPLADPARAARAVARDASFASPGPARRGAHDARRGHAPPRRARAEPRVARRRARARRERRRR